MRKCITTSLFGTHKIYTEGLIKNIELKNIFYSDFEFHVYYDDSVDLKLLDIISEKVFLHFVPKKISNEVPGYFWRFFLLDDSTKNLIICRDLDSRFSLREVLAVNEWVLSKKSLHVMRDHPHHNYCIMAGMWGLQNNRLFSIEEAIFSFLKNNTQLKNIKISDQIFLEFIYNFYENDRIIHDNWNRFGDCKKFPINRSGNYFVGEIFDENDNRLYSYENEIFH